MLDYFYVSTHSRLKAAGRAALRGGIAQIGFNTQPPEGGWFCPDASSSLSNSFNTQPPEGGWRPALLSALTQRCFNTQPPEGGWGDLDTNAAAVWMFQHTAA